MRTDFFTPLSMQICRFQYDFENLFEKLTFLDPLIKIEELIENQGDKEVSVLIGPLINCKFPHILQANVIELLLFTREFPSFVFYNGAFTGLDLCLVDQGNLDGQVIPIIDVRERGPGLFLQFRENIAHFKHSLYVIDETLS